MDKRANFVKVAEKRTNNVLKVIDSFANMGRSSYYEYTDEDIDKIANVIIEAVEKNIKTLKKREKRKRWSLE